MRNLLEEKRFFEFVYAFVFELLKRHTNPVRAAAPTPQHNRMPNSLVVVDCGTAMHQDHSERLRKLLGTVFVSRLLSQSHCCLLSLLAF